MNRNLSLILIDALNFAAEKHQYQRRNGYDRLPYINHLIKVVKTMMEVAQVTDEVILLAAILHDVIEDTDLTEEALAYRFNPKTAAIVRELSDDMTLEHAKRKQLQIVRAKGLSKAARMIRIADKVCNMRDLMSYPMIEWSVEKKRAYVKNSIQVVDEIRGTNAALENWFDETVEAINQSEVIKGYI